MRQPLGTIVQNAYVVEDLDRSMAAWLDAGIVGPFHVLSHLELVGPRYRGNPTQLDASIALAYSGGIAVELIQQHDSTPSVFNEQPIGPTPRFHHSAVMTEDFDGELAHYTAMGYAPAFEGAVAVGGRFAYVDMRSATGGLLELIELTPVVRQLFETIEQAAENWDGNDPIRHL